VLIDGADVVGNLPWPGFDLPSLMISSTTGVKRLRVTGDRESMNRKIYFYQLFTIFFSCIR